MQRFNYINLIPDLHSALVILLISIINYFIKIVKNNERQSCVDLLIFNKKLKIPRALLFYFQRTVTPY